MTEPRRIPRKKAARKRGASQHRHRWETTHRYDSVAGSHLCQYCDGCKATRCREAITSRVVGNRYHYRTVGASR